MSFPLDKHKVPAQTGFTLTELMVSVGIMVVIMTVVIYNQHDYSNSIILKNTADSLALDIRQAQVYGTSVREVVPGQGDFQSNYGVMLNDNGSVAANGYVLFVDQGAKDGVFDQGAVPGVCSSAECLSRPLLPEGDYISAIHFIDSSGNNGITVGRVDITFQRPNPAPKIMIDAATPLTAYNPPILGVRISIASPTGEHHDVSVYSTGQIYDQ
jgi:prepilin-type N-terminal cleavage/methylation domain-containing protein